MYCACLGGYVHVMYIGAYVAVHMDGKMHRHTGSLADRGMEEKGERGDDHKCN